MAGSSPEPAARRSSGWAAFAQNDAGIALGVGAGIFATEQVMGNYVDPRLQGQLGALSSLVVLVALLVWGWIRGIADVVQAVPITITPMIVCAHVPALRPLALMLSNVMDMKDLDDQTGRSGR